MKKPFLGWTHDKEVLEAQRQWYGYHYKKWYRRLWRKIKSLLK